LNGTSFRQLAVMAESVLQAAIFLVVSQSFAGGRAEAPVEDGSGQEINHYLEGYPEREEDDGRPSYFSTR